MGQGSIDAIERVLISALAPFGFIVAGARVAPQFQIRVAYFLGITLIIFFSLAYMFLGKYISLVWYTVLLQLAGICGGVYYCFVNLDD